MTTLGQAYVQIMPSAKGISGSIQGIINPEATAAGKSAGSRLATSMANSMGSLGKTLTKSITLPAMGAVTAVGGLVGALGFKRLVGMDVAQAKLKGLGIEGKQLEIVMDNTKNAVTGTTHTMADGADVAAGALAAGVKEGSELERYISLVGDAATGANAPMGEMAQIFNRVQGTGKLTRHELNQIEHRLPGFSQRMAKHVGADSLDAFYDMVSAGKVGSDEFLDVMDDFAGGMSEAYAGTWSGLKDNILANIGIIGEALLEGLFEDGKKGMAEFLDFLRNSEGLKEWATETGEKIREAFNTIIDVVKGAIQWWTGLDDGTKNLILTISGFIVALGPILVVMSKIVSTIITLLPVFKLLGAAIGAILSPIGLVVAAIIGAALLIFVYWEPIKEFFISMWEAIKDAGLLIWENLKEGWANAKENLLEAWSSTKEFFSELWESTKEIFITSWEAIKTAVATVINAIGTIISTVFNAIRITISTILNGIRTVVTTIWNGIRAAITTVLNAIRTIINSVWNAIRSVITSVLNGIRSVVTSVWNGIRSVITSVLNGIRSIVTSVWNGIRSVITSVLNGIRSIVSSVFNGIRSVISGVMNGIRSVISSGFNAARNIVSSVSNGIRSVVSSVFGALSGIVSGAMGSVRGAISSGMSSALSVVTGIAGRFRDAGRKIITSIADGIKGAASAVTGAIKDVTSKIRDFLPFSPAKEGPLKDIMDVKWGETIGGGIIKGESIVADAMDEILDFDLSKKAKFSNPYHIEDVNKSSIQNDRPIYLQVDGKTFAQIIGDYTSAEGGNRIRRIERGLA